MRCAIITLSLFFLTLGAAGVFAAEPLTEEESLQAVQGVAQSLKSGGEESYGHHVSRGQQLSLAFATLTGEAANPLLGVTVRSVYVYFRTPKAERDSLAWYYHPKVWGPLVLLMLCMACKGTVGEAVPLLKKPLDAAADLVSKGGAVASLPVVLAVFADSFAAPVSEGLTAAVDFIAPVAMAAEGGGGLGESAMLWLGWLVSLTLGLAVYLIVWLAFNTIEVLILICPFPAVDATLKSFRLAVIAGLTGVSKLSPTAGVIASILLILFCALIAGWSLRLSVFGFLYSLDIVFRRRFRTTLSGEGLRAFSGAALSDRIPVRTLGRLVREDTGDLSFQYRPWLVLPRRALALEVDSKGVDVGLGLLNPYLVKPLDGDGFLVLFRFPPCYQGHEEGMAEMLGAGAVRDTSIFRGIRAFFRFLRGEQLAAAS
ncbi:MAG: hypothetical protein ACYTGH_15735 [Planctomycetota bacterium]|jgi:hypothetical protein